MGRIFFLSLLKNCNHKRLGIYYLLSAFIFGISGTLVSVLMRIELYSSGNRIISPENQNFYNVSITLHGLLMIFFLVMPGLFGGFGNYFVVIFQGSPVVDSRQMRSDDQSIPSVVEPLYRMMLQETVRRAATSTSFKQSSGKVPH